jgi:type II secretory pathway pseudopilin PulG
MFKRFTADERGFTLLELMLGVTIVIIISGVAFAIYLDFRASAKHSEASINLNGIKMCEENYKLINGQYLDCLVHPDLPLTQSEWANARQWTGNTNFDAIGFITSGDVRFVYEVLDSTTTSFVALAHGNVDGDEDTVHFIATQEAAPAVYNGELIRADPAVPIDEEDPGDD